MSVMSTNRQGGYVDPLLIPLIAAVFLLITAAGFGAWAFSSRQDFKNNSDQKSAVAAAAAVKDAQQKDAAKYAEEAKDPLKQFVGPSQYGSVTAKYPKTWSGYVIKNVSNPLSAYFQPDVVGDIQDDDGSYALRIQVVNQSYASQLQSYDSAVKTGKATASPFSFAKVPSVVGTRIDGQISIKNQGTIIILPLRNLTLLVSTESQDFEADFNNIILPNFTFSP